MYTITLKSGHTFLAEEGKSLIDAAEAAGVLLPYSCRVGRCSSCKCKIDGLSHAIQDELGLTLEEILAGWSLACIRIPSGDLKIDIEDITNITLPKKKLIPAKIDALEHLSEDVLRVKLRLAPGCDFEYLAGQYVDVIGPGGTRRSYSLATLQGRGLIELHIRRVVSGTLSEYWFRTAKLNDLLRIEGPKGTFMPRYISETDVIFLATGTGIAPVKAMLEHISGAQVSERPRSVQLFWGGRRRSDFYLDPLLSLDGLSFFPTLSRPDADWSGVRGYVQDVALAQLNELNRVQVYACGSNAMIRSARSAFERAGLPSHSFFSDAFVASN